jgi:hypothetical protein
VFGVLARIAFAWLWEKHAEKHLYYYQSDAADVLQWHLDRVARGSETRHVTGYTLRVPRGTFDLTRPGTMRGGTIMGAPPLWSSTLLTHGCGALEIAEDAGPGGIIGMQFREANPAITAVIPPEAFPGVDREHLADVMGYVFGYRRTPLSE